MRSRCCWYTSGRPTAATTPAWAVVGPAGGVWLVGAGRVGAPLISSAMSSGRRLGRPYGPEGQDDRWRRDLAAAPQPRPLLAAVLWGRKDLRRPGVSLGGKGVGCGRERCVNG